MYATLSADIVSSTSSSLQSMQDLNHSLGLCLGEIDRKYKGFWGRTVRGDSIECVLDNPEDAFEIAILLKAWAKGYGLYNSSCNTRLSKYGLRVAIGIGDMNTVDMPSGMMDGESIYRSGRALDKELKGWSKYAFTISMENSMIERDLKVILELVNQILTKASARQCELLYYRIITGNSQLAAEKAAITVSGMNQALNTLGWRAIEQAIEYYRFIISKI